jgi:transcriptional regulator with XRE-family HTH domain
VAEYRWPRQLKLKLYLVEHGVTSRSLSKATGLSMGTITGVLSGRVRSTPHVRGLIAESLGVPALAVFANVTDPSEQELAEVADAGGRRARRSAV